MKTFNVVKKNRKYFAAVLENKYDCKILIDENSENLEIGTHSLEVTDISVRSKYGVDLIFKLTADAQTQKDAGICTLKADYNSKLVDRCRSLGGKWDAGSNAWIFSKLVESEVEELDFIYNSEKVGVEILVKEDLYDQPTVQIFGYSIASARGRDSGAKIADGISFVKGGARSGGSMKNWAAVVNKDSVIRMEIPAEVLNNVKSGWDKEIEITKI